MQESLINKAILEIRRMTPEQIQERMDIMLDEQPYLMGFLYNLDDDFDEEIHQALIRVCALLYSAFSMAEIEVGLISPAILESVINEKVEEYNTLSERDELVEENLHEVARSPMVFDELRKYVHDEINHHVAHEALQVHNISLMIDVLIGVMEESAIIEAREKEARGENEPEA